MLAEEELKCAEEREKEDSVSDEEMARRWILFYSTTLKQQICAFTWFSFREREEILEISLNFEMS